MITDVQSDKSFKVLHTKIQDFEDNTTEMIKTAQVDYSELDALPKTSFAWPEMRKLAMHTKEHAALSLIYSHNEDLPKHVVSNLEKAAALYEISLDKKPLEKVASSVSPFNKDDYLLPDRDGGMCKVASVNDIELSLEFLKRNGKSLDVMESAHAHKVLVKKASELQGSVPMYVSQEAGLTLCDLEKLAEWLEVRAVVAKKPEHKEAYTKLASVVTEGSEPITRNSFIKVATAIAIVDVEAGLNTQYHSKIQTPMRSVFNTEKIAEETVYFAGQNIPITQFAKLDTDTYSQVLGDDVIDEITTDGNPDSEKLMDIMHTLPADLQQTLLPYLNQA